MAQCAQGDARLGGQESGLTAAFGATDEVQRVCLLSRVQREVGGCGRGGQRSSPVADETGGGRGRRAGEGSFMEDAAETTQQDIRSKTPCSWAVEGL